MSSKYATLSLLLFLIVLLLGFKNYEAWFSPWGTTLKKESGKKMEGKPEPPPGILTPREPVPRQAFTVIAENSIFSPERKEFSMVAPATGMGKPVPRPQIVLYGVAISENYQAASITSAGRPLHKGEREMKTLKIGDTVGEYKLTKIMPDRIVMEAGEDWFEILLSDAKAPKRRVEVKTPTQPAAVTTTAPTPPPVIAPPPSLTPSPARPQPPIAVPLPRPAGPSGEGLERPGPSPPPSPDPGVWRGRRPLNQPGSQPGSETR